MPLYSDHTVHNKPAPDLDNRYLLSEIAEGHEPAFEKLFYLYKDRFFATALKMTRSGLIAEEIVQEIFMDIWHKRELLDRVENADAYLFSLVYHKIYRFYKQLSREKLSQQNAISEADNFEYTTDNMIFAAENARLINNAIEKLPQKQQLIFRLSRLQGYSREEIAYKLNISPNTVRNHLTEALKSMKKHLDNSLPLFLLVILLGK